MQIFGFEFYLSILVGCIYLAGGYLLATGPVRRRHGWSETPPTARQTTCFMAAVALIFFSLNGPLHRLSDDYLFSAHMVQHMLVMLLMPPLLIAGLPHWLIRAGLRQRPVALIARFLTHPVTAFVAYNVVFIGWHFPRMYNAALINHNLHIVQHISFMAVSVMMWWPVVNPVKELEVLPTGPLLILYVFVFGIPATALSAMLTLSDSVFYPWYALAPRVTSLSALDDQRLGGLIMWVPGMLIFWTAMTIVFFRWTKDEYRSWGRGSAGVLLAVGASSLGGGALEAQTPSAASPQAGRPPFRAETELGASLFFGNTEQLTVTHRGDVGRADERIEVGLGWTVAYGEATDIDGATAVSRRDWAATGSMDWLTSPRFSPFLFGSLEYSLQKRIDQRFSGGAGGKVNFIRSERSQVDLSGAVLAERTVARDAEGQDADLLARWSIRGRARRSFDNGRLTLGTTILYVPAFRDPADFTLNSTTALSVALSQRVALRLSLLDSYDSGATKRGARTNNDGQVTFSVVAQR